MSIRTEMIRLTDLTFCPPEKNPNKMTPTEYAMLVEAMRASHDGSGEVMQPILVADHDGVREVVDGNHRGQAAIELGWAEIECKVRDDWGAQEVIAYRLGMNRNRGHVDLGIAGAIVTELKFDGWNAADMIVTGFAADEIADLTKSTVDAGAESDLLADAGATDVEDEPAPSSKPFVLEITFRNREDFLLAKRKLRKAAGKTKDLARGLMAVLGEE